MAKRYFNLLITIGAPLIITLGVIKHSYYYYFFNIEIVKFMELSELLGLFLFDLVLYVLAILITVALSVFFYNKRLVMKIKKRFIEYIKIDDFPERVKYYFKAKPQSFISILVNIFLGFITNLEREDIGNLFYFLALFSFLGILLQIITYEIKRKWRLEKTLFKKNEYYENVFYVLYLLIITIISYTTVEAYNVKHNFRYLNTSIEFEDHSFKSDSLNYYIGHTSKFMFIYDKKNDETTAHMFEDINKLTFGKNPVWDRIARSFQKIDKNEKKDSIEESSIKKEDSIIQIKKYDTEEIPKTDLIKSDTIR